MKLDGGCRCSICYVRTERCGAGARANENSRLTALAAGAKVLGPAMVEVRVRLFG